MYLHLGNDVVVLLRDVLAIFDLDNGTVSKITREYLQKAEEENRLQTVTTDLPKSFVVTREQGKTKIYLSQISPAALKRRAQYMENLSNL